MTTFLLCLLVAASLLGMAFISGQNTAAQQWESVLIPVRVNEKNQRM
jgi:hypothetical protein